MISLTTTKGRTTIVRVGASEGSSTAGLGISGEGVAKCRPDDFYNEATGELIALGRAIQDFGQQVEQAGRDRVTSKLEMAKVMAALGIDVVFNEHDSVEAAK
jgi:hypothetical protein